MQYSLPKKWRTRYWAGFALLLAGMMALGVGVLLGGGVLLVLVCVLLFLGALALAVVSSLKLRCPACGQTVDRMALMNDAFFCPKCGGNIHME